MRLWRLSHYRWGAGAELPEYVAWHEPAHDILKSASQHFVRPMGQSSMDDCHALDGVYYDGEQLIHQRECPSVAAVAAECGGSAQCDVADRLQPTSSTRRVEPKVMEGHLPSRFWKNLPEGKLIPGWITEARTGKQKEGRRNDWAKAGRQIASHHRAR